MESLHAACIALSGAGVLIRGPSGAGKSTLALLLAESPGGAFVADDRVRVSVRDGILVAVAHPGEGGRVEIRGQGLLAVDALGLAIHRDVPVVLAVDLVESLPRMPDPAAMASILGIALPRLVLDRDVRSAGLAPLLVRAALRSAAA